MERILELLKRKGKLLYDINCIHRYIESGEYDQRLKLAWDQLQEELKEVNSLIDSINVESLVEFEQEKLDILRQISDYQEKIVELKLRLSQLDKNINQTEGR